MFIWAALCRAEPMPRAAPYLVTGSAAPATAPPAAAMSLPPPAFAADAQLCRGAIAAAEAAMHIPDLFLSAIGRVESGRPLPAGGPHQTFQVAPWPWTVDAEGLGRFYASKAEAVTAVQALQARGVRSIDVGCLQVNLLQHPEAFATLDQAFDPSANAHFAAKLLASLFDQTGSWPRAAAAYHSQTPALGAPYQQRVLAEWATPDRPVATAHEPAAPPRHAVAPGTAAIANGPVAASPPSSGQSTMGYSRSLRSAPAAGDAQAAVEQHGRSLDAYRKYPVAFAVRPRHPG